MESTSLAQTFARDGIVAKVSLLSDEKAESYCQKMEEFVAAHGDDPRYGDWTYFKSHLLLVWVAQIAQEPAILDAVEAVLGPNILLWNSFLPIKRPFSGGYFGWHQDGTFWDIAPLTETVTVWLALGSVGEHNGGMRVIPGSHRWGQLEHEKTFDPQSMLRRGQRITADFDEHTAVDITLAAGQASLHNSAVLHGSTPNHSTEWRWGVGLNYVSGNVAPINSYQDSAWLLRGQRVQMGFATESPPASSLSADALAEYERAVQRSATRYEK
ncbi:MAG: phytanoyl-CoA dioxygenase family protein [Chloroflexota bacterium]